MLRCHTLPSKENFPRQRPAQWLLQQIFLSPVQCRTFLPHQGVWPELPVIALNIICILSKFHHTSIVKVCIYAKPPRPHIKFMLQQNYSPVHPTVLLWPVVPGTFGLLQVFSHHRQIPIIDSSWLWWLPWHPGALLWVYCICHSYIEMVTMVAES